MLSPSTEDYDRGEKLEHYKQIDTLQEVMLVHHDEHKVTIWRRTAQGWSATVHVDGVAVVLGCELSVDAIYRDPLV